jgi:hypothetical protein
MTAIGATLRNRRRRWWSGLLAVLAAILAATATPAAALADQKPTPGPAQNSPGDLSPQQRAAMDAQRPLVAAASRIQWSAMRGDSSGYAGIVLGAGDVVVWWKGVLPDAVAHTIADVRRTTPIRVAAAAYSRAELEAAAKGVASYLRAHPASPYHSIQVAYDGSRLTVVADPGRARPAALPAAMALPAGIPVAVVEQDRPHLSGRLNDSPPYWGGGRIQNNDNNAFCTAGWPVTMNGANYMLTAGHCGRPGGSWNNGDDSRFFGTGAAENVAHDLLLISASVAGRIWDGGVGTGEFTKGVAGWDWVFPHEELCTSGSVTGARCGDVVSDNLTFAFCDDDVYGNHECFNDLVTANQKDNLPASNPGDSGGPVFGLSGTDRVIAKGTITGRFGTNGLIFQDFGTAVRDFGLSPMIG